ncbi:MAG: thiamine-phosphate kinase [Magnetovibrio sp.]|nr:thiamine-phosphate kinase [Magnetovibrio sp.]
MSAGSEFDIIDRYFKPLAAGHPGALGLLDDAALMTVQDGHQLVVTSDALVEGVHFLNAQSPQDIAHKVVGVNLSDLAAMGARPCAVFLAAQFPPHTDEAWIADFAKGLGESLGESGAVLMGGDTVSTPGPMAFTLTALGEVKTGKALTRSGAKAGDALFVSGTIGDGALGLLCETGKLPKDDYLSDRYARPQARLSLGMGLADLGLATACIDVSDGLVADVGHLCEASNVGATLQADRVPMSLAVKSCLHHERSLFDLVLAGGDDFELAFGVKHEHIESVESLSQKLGIQVTQIGVFEADKPGVRVVNAHGQELSLKTSGYRHL